jgi:probable addiction module antidote protein
VNNLDPKKLRDNPALIASYLSVAFATDDLSTILRSLREVLRAQNVMALSRATGLRRDKLYTTFGGDVDPHFSRVLRLLEGFGVELIVRERLVTKPKPPRPKLGRPRKTVAEE